MSESVRAGLLAQLQSGAHADVLIRFHLERTPEEQQPNQQQLGPEAEGAKDTNVAGDLQLLGDALQAHKVILTLGSTYLEARLQGACWQGARAGAPRASHAAEERSDCDQGHRDKRLKSNDTSQQPSEDGQQGRSSAAVSALPEVLVPLSSEAEVPFVSRAIEYIYTGSLSADLDFEALLRVRQQACYLGVKCCAQACDQAMLAWLAALQDDKPSQQGQQQEQQQRQQQQQTADGADVHKTTAAEPRVVQAYACHALFPQPGTSPDAASFDAVRSALAKQLVSHFGDAVAALTRPDLYRQLLQLPAVAVRELLAADDFGTDSEDSVFLLLAAWLEANRGGVPAAARAELCGLVRLHRLRPLYLNFVLPAYEPFSVISRVELGFLTRYAGAGELERTRLLDMDAKRRLYPWYCSPARRQVVPEKGRTVEWSISREQLEQGLKGMVEGKTAVYLFARFGAPATAVGEGVGSAESSTLSDGGLWGVKLKLDPAASETAGIFVTLTAPRQLGRVQGMASLAGVQLVVHSWAAGQRTAGFASKFAGDVIETMSTWGWLKGLTLPPAAASGGGGEGSAAGGVEAEVAAQLARWSGWLHEGKITGSVTFPRA